MRQERCYPSMPCQHQVACVASGERHANGTDYRAQCTLHSTAQDQLANLRQRHSKRSAPHEHVDSRLAVCSDHALALRLHVVQIMDAALGQHVVG